VALHGGELLLEGLTDESLQGDRVVADIYAAHFGVQTTFTAEGAHLSAISHCPLAIGRQQPTVVKIDFTNCPDLYPAVALTCERLGIILHATGTERLAYKESNRLEAVARHETRHDHRMAMALLVAGWPVDDTDCIAKSYPAFMEQWRAIRANATAAITV
jgi:5-enolpyruvylshikimate-3-phosphate synthase